MADHALIDHTGIPGVGGSGSVATDAIWTTAGKVAVATGTATATEQWPPAHEFDYVQYTSPVSITNGSEATADTIVTGSAVTYDGSTVVMIEYSAPYGTPSANAGANITYYLFDGSSSIGKLGLVIAETAANHFMPIRLEQRLTPSAAAHTYSIRATSSTGTASAGAGAAGTGNYVPGFIRITKV